MSSRARVLDVKTDWLGILVGGSRARESSAEAAAVSCQILKYTAQVLSATSLQVCVGWQGYLGSSELIGLAGYLQYKRANRALPPSRGAGTALTRIHRSVSLSRESHLAC